MSNERLDIPLLLLLMWASFAAFAQDAASRAAPTVIAAVTPSVWTEGVLIALIGAVATTIVSIATLIIGVINTRRINEVDVKVAEVKKATDGMTTALVNNAAEKGRTEGAALATAGAAAVKTQPATALPAGSSDADPIPVKVVDAVPVPVTETPNK